MTTLQFNIQVLVVFFKICLKEKAYSNYLNTGHPNSGFIWLPDTECPLFKCWITWLCKPFEYWTFWITNRLFQSGFQTTIWKVDHLTTGHKSTIWILRWLLYFQFLVTSMSECAYNLCILGYSLAIRHCSWT